jgi:hypothetical protein
VGNPAAPGTRLRQDRTDGANGFPHAGEIGTEPVHVAPFAQEIVLHIYDNECSICGLKTAPQGKVVRLSFNGSRHLL